MSLHIQAAHNRTRYSTDDINLFFATFVDAVNAAAQPQADEPQHQLQFELPHVSSLGYLFDSKAPGGELSHLGQSCLFLASPARLAREEPVQSLGALALDRLPRNAARELAEYLVSNVRTTGHRYYYSQDEETREARKLMGERFQAARPAIIEAAAQVNIRVMPRVEAGPQRKLSAEQALVRFKSSGFYGSGGVLQGPGWAYASGDRSPTWRWHGNLATAQNYYERERDHRMGWLKKIEELGGTVEPYESFADFLRSYADELDKRHGGY